MQTFSITVYLCSTADKSPQHVCNMKRWERTLQWLIQSTVTEGVNKNRMKGKLEDLGVDGRIILELF